MTDQTDEPHTALIGHPSRAASARSIADDLQAQIGHIFELARAPFPASESQLQKTLACLATVLEDRANLLTELQARPAGIIQADAIMDEADLARITALFGNANHQGVNRIVPPAADAAALRARIAELEAALGEILGSYWERGYVGCESVRTPWIRAERLEQWRRMLADNTAAAKSRPAPEYLTPDAWCERYGLHVQDPDGWRKPNALRWETPITLPDFWERFGRSTVMVPPKDVWDRIVDDVRTAKQAGGEP